MRPGPIDRGLIGARVDHEQDLAGLDHGPVIEANLLDIAGNAGADVDLRSFTPAQVRNIEVIDMTGAGADRLTLDRSEILDISSTTNTLRIFGDPGDVVDLTGASTDARITGGFHRYRMGAAVLLVENDVMTV